MHPLKPNFSHAKHESSTRRLSDGQSIYLSDSLLTAEMKGLIQLLTDPALTSEMFSVAFTPVGTMHENK